MPLKPGISTPALKWPWTRCDVRRRKQVSRFCPAARSGVLPFAVCCFRSRTFCFWMNRRITSMRSLWRGSNITSSNMKVTVIAVTHDRYFLDNVAGWILELDRGHGIPWEGNYSSWLEQKRIRLQQEEKTETQRQKTLQRELEWIRMSPKGRHAKGKARINSYETLLSKETEKSAQDLEIYIPAGPRLGQVVIEAEKLRKAFGDRLLFDDLNFRLPPGGIVGVIGPNGAGKTTLFRMIVGQEKPDHGILRIGDSVVISYVDQNRDALAPENSIFQEISGGQDPIVL